MVGRSACRCAGRSAACYGSLPSRRIARVLFFAHESRIGVVHGFIKKTQRTPPDDLALARRRMMEMMR
jgi:phage-related protein